ncbi:MAG TPA: hypothetical protein VNV86_10600 [Candidatus Acidoferrum sp.]|nr:hypothetical protein [Candidatus Acidoferrum sp.]
MTNPSGVGRATVKYSGWSTRFVDIDNDGWKDLFVAQGHVMDNIEVAAQLARPFRPDGGRSGVEGGVGRARRGVRRPG